MIKIPGSSSLEKKTEAPEKISNLKRNQFLGSDETVQTLDGEDICLEQIIDVKSLQQLMDGFSHALGIPAIIYDMNGRPITKPSSFSKFCSLVRSVPEGRRQCEIFDARLFEELSHTRKNIVRKNCVVKNIITGTIPILVGGYHLANVGMGQMVESGLDENELRRFARKIHLSEEKLLAASRRLMPYKADRFNSALSFLDTIASQISRMGFQNLMQAKLISEKENAEQLFKTAFESSPDAIHISRLDGTYSYVNKGTVKLTGYQKHEFIGKKSEDLNIWVDGKGRERIYDRLNKKGTVSNFEADFRIKNGTIVTGLISASLIEFDGEKHMLCIIRDISEIKRTQEALRESEIKLHQVQKLETVGTLAGGIAHDFNNILFPVIVLTEILLEKDLPEKIKEDLNSILKAGKRARELVSQILTFSRKHQKKLEPMMLHPIVKEIIKLTRSTLPSNIRIDHKVDEASGLAMIDAVQFQQIIMNLISNAFHAMESTGGVLSIALFPEKRKCAQGGLKKYICLKIDDSGIGMTPAVMDKIFDPYFTTKEQDKGSGLGLAVTHGIVKSFNGEITVESRLDRGTSFRVYLPVLETSFNGAECKESLKKIKGHQENILVVDDEVAITGLLKKLLERSGFKVEAFNDSWEALDCFKKSPGKFVLVISDLTMPDMTGDQLCLEISKIKSDIPKILLTGYNESWIMENREQFGIDTILIKPLEKNEILKAIGQLIK